MHAQTSIGIQNVHISLCTNLVKYFYSTTAESFGPPGEFEVWGEWTECSKTCGVGRRSRRRECLLDEDGVYMDCTGELLQIENCTVGECPGLYIP